MRTAPLLYPYGPRIVRETCEKCALLARFSHVLGTFVYYVVSTFLAHLNLGFWCAFYVRFICVFCVR
jgi:hypothetical protein